MAQAGHGVRFGAGRLTCEVYGFAHATRERPGSLSSRPRRKTTLFIPHNNYEMWLLCEGIGWCTLS